MDQKGRDLIFRIHAVQRMFERDISVEDVKRVLSEGVVIEDYPEDTPFPSRLIFGWCERRPIHVVVAINEVGSVIVVTVYEPDQEKWDEDLSRRRS
jgi:hypothetical protein